MSDKPEQKKRPLVGEAMDAILARRAAVGESRIGEIQQFGPNDIYGPGESAYKPTTPGMRADPEGQIPATQGKAPLQLKNTAAAVAANWPRRCCGTF
jgi:hypothetical protein